MDNYYSFVFKGLLTEEALDKAGRRGKQHFTEEEEKNISKTLAIDELDNELVLKARRMAIVYTAIATFENSVRANMKRFLLTSFVTLLSFCFTQAQSPVLIDLNPGLPGSMAENFAVVNNHLYVHAYISNIYQLWKTDGTQPGTSLVKNVDFGTYSVANVNNKVIFPGQGIQGYQPWVSDGTTNGTLVLKEINGAYQTGSTPNNFFNFNGNVYFAAEDTVFDDGFGHDIHEYGLWKTNGTNPGTELIYTYYYCFLCSSSLNGGQPGKFQEYNGQLYFMVTDSFYTDDIWVTDGTGNGTLKVMVNPAGAEPGDFPYYLTLNGNLYMFAHLGSGITELWQIHTGTKTATKLNLFGTASFWIAATINNKFYVLKEVNGGEELWITDGTSPGTSLVKVLNTSGGSGAGSFTELNNKIYFFADDGTGTALWVTDNTSAGTVKVKTFGLSEWAGWEVVAYNGKIYFTVENSSTQLRSFWQTDGTNAGTVSFATETGNNSGEAKFTIMNGSLYFNAQLDNNGTEVWKLSTTPSGIDELVSLTAATIFPNPATNQLTVNLGGLQAEQVRIYNVNGKLVSETKQPANNSIDISSLAKGIYVAETKVRDAVERVRWVKM